MKMNISKVKWLAVPALGAAAIASVAQSSAQSPAQAPSQALRKPAPIQAPVQIDTLPGSNAMAQPAPEDVLRNAAGAKVEIAFVLDTTGSMSDLIEGAKRKIWSIVSTISTAKPTPHVRIGFVAYRDKGDDYVTQVHDLTDDLDRAFKTLGTFQADGGGDTPEHVHRAISDAVSKLKWSDARQEGGSLYQVIFLVGDAPPHSDYNDGFDGKASIRRALARGITLNAIQCGDMAATVPAWQNFARIGEGKYFAIAQSGGMTAIATPYDAEISRLSDEIESTTVARGGSVMRYGRRVAASEAQASSGAANAGMSPASKADRATFNANSGQVYGDWDMTTQAQSGKLKPEDAAKMKDSELPPEMKKMPAPERAKYLQGKVQQREAAQKKLLALQKQREAYMQAQLAKSGQSDKNSFDALVKSTMRAQAARRGIRFK